MKYLLVPAIMLMMLACSTVKVSQNFDKQVSFESFKTFSLYPWDKQNDAVVNEYDKKLILDAVQDQMIKKGYQYVEKDGELIVSVFVIIKEKTMNQAYTNHYGGWAGYGSGWDYYGSTWAYGYGWAGPAYTTTTVSSRDYVEGTLLIDILSLADKKLIWQGVGVGEVNPDFSKRDKNIPKAIGHIFRRFPTK